MAAGDYTRHLGLGKFVLRDRLRRVAGGAVRVSSCLANRVNPATCASKAFSVLSFSSYRVRGAERATAQHRDAALEALGVDSASANLASKLRHVYRAERVRGRVPGDATTVRGAYQEHRRAVSYVLRAAHRRGGCQLWSVWQGWAGSDVRLGSSWWGRWGFLSRWWPSSHPWSRSSTCDAPPSTSATPWWRALQPRMLRATRPARFWTDPEARVTAEGARELTGMKKSPGGDRPSGLRAHQIRRV